jgi:hypothetical protein
MRPTRPALIVCAYALLATACGGDDAGSAPADAAIDATPSPTFAPDESPYGRSLGQWAAAWWTWALELPRTDHPIAGGPCTAGQEGDVFFLAGNFGGAETRTCTVPAGKALMFPLLNSICWPNPESEGCDTASTDAELGLCASRIFDSGPAHTMAVTLDGAVIVDPESYRASTGHFSWPPPTFPESEWLAPALGPIGPNACGIPEGDRFGVGDGYWMILRPLAPGAHVLRITASIANTIDIDVTYQLTQE